MICDNLTVEGGVLRFAGRAPRDLIERYGSPLYVMDEARVRRNMRTYIDAMHEAFDERAMMCYASKACAFLAMYRIAAEEGAGVDVVSMGEAYTAYKAGFPMERVCFHGNNKTDEEISRAMDWGVGCFVVDCTEELAVIEREAAARDITQRVMLRITPGIDTHTYEAVATGQVDSKFGSAIETGQAAEITGVALGYEHITLGRQLLCLPFWRICALGPATLPPRWISAVATACDIGRATPSSISRRISVRWRRMCARPARDWIYRCLRCGWSRVAVSWRMQA